MAKDTAEALRWVLQDSKAVFTISQYFPGHANPARELHPCYILDLGPPSTDVKIFDTLLLEAMQDPTRNARYELGAEKCAQIAQSLWLSLLPL